MYTIVSIRAYHCSYLIKKKSKSKLIYKQIWLHNYMETQVEITCIINYYNYRSTLVNINTCAGLLKSTNRHRYEKSR